MNVVNDKEKMLKNVRDALIDPDIKSSQHIDLDTSVYFTSNNSLDIEFAENFIKNGGKFIYCESIQEAIASIRFFAYQENWETIYCTEETLKRLLNHCGLPFVDKPEELLVQKIGITTCDFLIAQTGSIIFSSQSESGRRVLSVLDKHIVVATVEQIKKDLKSAFQLIKEKFPNKMPSMFSIINGNSKIIDINANEEKGLGASKLFLFLIDSSSNQ